MLFCEIAGKGPPFLGGPEQFLLYPVFDLRAEPGGPLINALAGAGGDGDDLDVGIQAQHMLFAGFQIKVNKTIKFNEILVIFQSERLCKASAEAKFTWTMPSRSQRCIYMKLSRYL